MMPRLIDSISDPDVLQRFQRNSFHRRLTMRQFTNSVFGAICTGILLMHSAAAADPSDQISALVKPLVDGKRVMGVSVGVIADGKTTTMHFGKTARSGETADDDTVYEIGSISKVFTSLILSYAAERGVVKLDQSAGDLLPEGVKMPAADGQPITLLHLATHRSGLPRLPENLVEVTDDNPYSRYTTKRAHQFLNDYQLPRKPGEKYEYSNFGASLLGSLLCRKAKKPYDTLLRQTITGPLKMTSTSVDLIGDMTSRMATPHGANLKPTSTWEFADMPGAGGIRSSTKDMLKFAAANLDPPDNATGQAIELAWKQHQPTSDGELAMGLGWHFAGDGTTRWHNGGTGGYRSMLMINRELDVAVFVVANSVSDRIDGVAAKILQSLAGMSVQPTKIEKETDVPMAKMKRLVGRYQLAPTFIFDVKIVDGKLMVGVTNQPTQQVFATSETEWFYKVVDAKLVFKIDDDGQAESLTLHQNGAKQLAPRMSR